MVTLVGAHPHLPSYLLRRQLKGICAGGLPGTVSGERVRTALGQGEGARVGTASAGLPTQLLIEDDHARAVGQFPPQRREAIARQCVEVPLLPCCGAERIDVYRSRRLDIPCSRR